MLASLILGFMLLGILGFLACIRLQAAACEGGVYHAPLDSAEAWSASLDVALGLDLFSDDHVDNGWSMLPMVDAWVMVEPMPMVRRAPRVRVTHITLRELALMCV